MPKKDNSYEIDKKIHYEQAFLRSFFDISQIGSMIENGDFDREFSSWIFACMEDLYKKFDEIKKNIPD